MNNENYTRCQICDRINPTECNRADCPMEDYFWSLTEDDNE